MDSTFYSTVSMLRTMEDIVGIQPLTRFDAYATPMGASFTNRPNYTPYSAVRPSAAGNTPQSATAPMASYAAQQNPQQADQLDDQLLNEAIWKSVRRAGSTMPAPRHATAPATGTGGAGVGAGDGDGDRDGDG